MTVLEFVTASIPPVLNESLCRLVFRKSRVRIAVQPAFPRLRRGDYWMIAFARMLRRVAVRRVIATADRAAFLTDPEMDP
jgi:hypothetical protein